MKEKSTSGRRNFLKISSLGAGLIGSLSSFDLIKKGSSIISDNKEDLHLKVAGYDFPRLKALTDKKVSINMLYSELPLGELPEPSSKKEAVYTLLNRENPQLNIV